MDYVGYVDVDVMLKMILDINHHQMIIEMIIIDHHLKDRDILDRIKEDIKPYHSMKRRILRRVHH